MEHKSEDLFKCGFKKYLLAGAIMDRSKYDPQTFAIKNAYETMILNSNNQRPGSQVTSAHSSN